MIINKRRKGQSLLELSIFGALLMIFIAALLSYGLKNNYTQQVMQQTFRKALALAKKERNTNYLFINDRHIPDPSDTFAVGSFTPTISSAAVTRNYRMNETAKTIDALPSLAIEIKGNTSCWGVRGANSDNPSLCYYLTAGFRDDSLDEPTGNACDKACRCMKMRKWDKFELIYGLYNIKGHKSNGDGWNEDDDGWKALNSIYVIDSCEGEILDYDTCHRQCEVIKDQEECKKFCEEGGDSEQICVQKCSPTIPTPWYCDKLDNFFQTTLNNLKTMGIQQYSEELNLKHNILGKAENPASITTTDTLYWEHYNANMIIFKHYGDTSGFVDMQPMVGEVSQDKKESWKTSW